MSVHQHFDNPEPVARLYTAPIVLRFASLFPRDLKRRAMHGKRKGGDLSHIREELTGLNCRWVEEDGWIDELRLTIDAVADQNLKNEIEAREKKGRWKEARDVVKRGLVEPWKFTKEGPLREGILTVHKDWFGGTGIEQWDPERVAMFLDRSIAFLREHFPDEQLVEVESHVDEEAFHLHFMVVVWVEKVSENRGRQILLQPSANPLLSNYEYAQDLAGEAFADLGIHRGEPRARAAREAAAAGLEGPSPREHVPPSKWRKEQRRLARKEAALITEKAEQERVAILNDAPTLAQAVVKKSRKHAVKMAKLRRKQTDKAVALARQDLQAVEARSRHADRAAQDAEANKARIDAQVFDLVQNVDELSADVKIKEAQRTQLETQAAEMEQARKDSVAARLEADRRAFQAEHIAMMELERADAAVARSEAMAGGMTALAEEVARRFKAGAGKKSIGDALWEKLEPAYPEIAPVVSAAETVVDAVQAISQQSYAYSVQLENEYRVLDEEKKKVADEWTFVTRLRKSLQDMVGRVARWLSHPELPQDVATDGADILRGADRCLKRSYEGGPHPMRPSLEQK